MSEGYQPERGYGGGGDGEGRPTSVQVQEKMGETARQVTGQVQEKAQQASQQVGGRVREQVNQRSTQAGEQVQSMSQALRQTGEQLRGQGNEPQAKFADQAAERMERLGGYLTEADADRILGDIEDFGRRRPWALAFAGATLGFVASRFLKASSTQRYESRQAIYPTGTDGSWTAPARPGLEPTAATAPAAGFTGTGYDPAGPAAPGTL